MSNSNVARDVLWPNDSSILVRAAFLHVGQGQSTVVFVRDGKNYRVLLVDTNMDKAVKGIDIPKMMKDLLDGQSLDAFVNTHPHDDHLCGTKELEDAIEINEVWHSNHKPSSKYGTKHSELTDLIANVTKKHGKDAEKILEGSNSSVAYGDAFYHMLAPAQYVTDDVNDEKPDQRRARIHEQCGVIKFGKDNTWIIIVGDADKAAFENHITVYHKDRLPSQVLAASHHGSRTFFMDNEGDDPYKKGLEAINPEYVIVSAPKVLESKHDHPHPDSMKIYQEHCGNDGVLHTGKNRYCFITDIYDDGNYSGVQDDQGELSDEYGIEEDGGDDDGGKKAEKSAFGAIPPYFKRTRVDDKPMGMK